MAKFYAWSRIRHAANIEKDTKQILNHKHIEAGEEVTPEILGISESKFKELVRSGAIRQYEYPVLPNSFKGSPIQYLRHIARQVEAGAAQVDGRIPSILPTTVQPGNESEDDGEVNAKVPESSLVPAGTGPSPSTVTL